ncbi:MAG: PTS sugar transporter subunit IIB [Christensenellaceae bacterium]|nr:PTS sugar transporter subunit IIB [Christensenellaceae bacterium]
MANISLVRIDERMIHGQVVAQWIRCIHCEKILLVDDGVYKDEFLTKVVKMACPSDIELEVATIDIAAKYLLDENADSKALMVLVRHPNTIEALVDKGVSIPKLNLGGMGLKAGRKRLYHNIAVSPEEAETFKRLAAKGVETTIQMTPSERVIDLMKKLK